MFYRGIILALIVFAAATACAADEIAVFAGRTMGTTFHVRCLLPADVSEDDISQRIAARLDKVNQQMSTYIDDSELSRFNHSTQVDTWLDVSPETAKVVAYALEVAADSNGAFDPTVGPVVDLWGFGPPERRPQPPTDEEVSTALESVSYRNVKVREDPPALQKAVATVQLDLSAVAKGYGVDAIGEELEAVGCTSYMVEIGGEVLTKGRKPGGAAWRIGIEAAAPGAKTLSKVLALTDEAIATSGDYRNFFEYEGRRYSHTIDPITGRPVEHDLAVVTVRAATCMQADALATAILALGPRAGYDWAEDRGLAALLVERQGDAVRELPTTAWTKALAADAATDSPQTQASDFMWVYLLAAVVIAIAMAAMAVGVMFSGRRIQGSCGGLAGLRDESGNTACELCSNPSPTCSGNPEERDDAELSQQSAHR